MLKGNSTIATTYLPLAGGTLTGPLVLSAGSTTNKPVQFQSGPLLTSPAAGVVEFLTDKFYGTITTGAARKTFAFLESPTFTGTVSTSPITMSNSSAGGGPFTMVDTNAGGQTWQIGPGAGSGDPTAWSIYNNTGSALLLTLTSTGRLYASAATPFGTKTTATNGGAAAAGTLLNAPVAGNPTKWVPFDDNGTTRYIPMW